MSSNLYTRRFKEISISDVPSVGGKNASLGEMFTNLTDRGVRIPDGFATTAFAFEEFLTNNSLHEPLLELMNQLDRKQFKNLEEIGRKSRTLILAGSFPRALSNAIGEAYQALSEGTDISVAVRSSATAEDLPEASFAGQHESFLNVSGTASLLQAVKQCFASLYTDRAIKYREDNGFAHEKVALSVGVQRMVRSDMACSGVAFTLEPETGFRDIIHISGVWGLGENIVQGTITPDEFLVFKPTLQKQKYPIIKKTLGEKALTMIYQDDETHPTVNIPTEKNKQQCFVLQDNEIIQLATWSLAIENYYQRPMDIEWAKDGISGEIFIIQARPETVHSSKSSQTIKEYTLKEQGTPLCRGNAVGSRITTGIARVLSSPDEAQLVQPHEIIVTELTSPDWDPILKKAGGIITNKGGRTSHASIVARELDVPAIVGCGDATSVIKTGQLITVSCAQGATGYVYDKALKFQEKLIDVSAIERPGNVKAMFILGDPDKAFRLSFYPNDGVGLMRMEFIVTHSVRIHPMALVKFDALKDQQTKADIADITQLYPDKEQYFVDKLAEGIATIAAAFYPKEVIVRTSDFKTNEYAQLIGGKDFEPAEENPMLGFRGASRYYNPLYQEGFRLECQAIRKVRNMMGLENVKVMIPFCRTVEEGKRVIAMMKKYGLEQHADKLQVYVMAEIPSNILQAAHFAEVFDGFSIGSNDLTQLTLGIDRDSSIISDLFDEEDPAVKEMISNVIHKAKAAGVPVGLCGQAPSDLPSFAKFLVHEGIDSISFNPDALIRGIENIKSSVADETRKASMNALLVT